MENSDDLNVIAVNAIRQQVWSASNQQFTSSGNPAGTSTVWVTFQPPDRRDDPRGNPFSRLRIVPSDVFANLRQVRNSKA